MRNTRLDIHPMTGGLGAEILDIDLAADHAEATWRDVRQALCEYGVIFFREQTITPDQQIAFAKRFGQTTASAHHPRVAGFPELNEIRKEPEQKTNVGGGYHTDHPYFESPTMGTILLAREVPEFGGDTMFISLSAAYEALSGGLKRTLETLRATHSNARLMARRQAMDGRRVNLDRPPESASHPVVVAHPETGRKILYVNPAYVDCFEGWTVAESQSLLDYLFQHAKRPEFACRFTWREGSMAFWDNRQTWHYAVNDYHGQRRVMHRIMVEGGKLE